MQEKHPTFQSILDSIESDTPNTSFQKDALVLAHLNYQVENGGFQQWVENGYCTEYDALHEVLSKINTPTSQEVLQMIEQLRPFINDSAENTGCWGNYWIEEDDDEEDYDEIEPEGIYAAEQLNSKYYQINSKLLDEIESWFNLRQPQILDI